MKVAAESRAKYEQGERLFQKVSQTSPEIINFIRQYID
jgi:hypothetical protein